MQTNRFPTFTLVHDGAFAGAMYLCDRPIEGIVVTPSMLEKAVRAGDDFWVELTGPDSTKHKRMEVTVAPAHDVLVEGDLCCRTLRVARRDLENVLVFGRAARLVSLAESVSMGPRRYAQVAQDLDRALAIVDMLNFESHPRPA